MPRYYSLFERQLIFGLLHLQSCFCQEHRQKKGDDLLASVRIVGKYVKLHIVILILLSSPSYCFTFFRTDYLRTVSDMLIPTIISVILQKHLMHATRRSRSFSVICFQLKGKTSIGLI